jgi:hypothetical protein
LVYRQKIMELEGMFSLREASSVCLPLPLIGHRHGKHHSWSAITPASASMSAVLLLGSVRRVATWKMQRAAPTVRLFYRQPTSELDGCGRRQWFVRRRNRPNRQSCHQAARNFLAFRKVLRRSRGLSSASDKPAAGKPMQPDTLLKCVP